MTMKNVWAILLFTWLFLIGLLWDNCRIREQLEQQQLAQVTNTAHRAKMDAQLSNWLAATDETDHRLLVEVRGLHQTTRALVQLLGESVGERTIFWTNVTRLPFTNWTVLQTNVSTLELGRWGTDWGLGYSNPATLK